MARAKKETAEVTGWSDRERDHYHEIQNLARVVLKSRTVYLESKEETSEFKKKYDRDTEALETLINQGPNPQQPLPFGGGEEEEED